MNAESEERPYTGREWAEEYLPIPADTHHTHRAVEMPDMAKAKRVEDMIIGLFGLALLLAAAAAIVLSAIGVQP